MAPVEEPLEAVIISGSRKGQIIRLPNSAELELTPEELHLLDEALDTLLTKLDRLAEEMRLTKEALRPRPETI